MAEAYLLGMSAIFVNGVFFVLPIAERLYGAGADEVIVGIVVIDSVVVFGGSIFLMDLLTTRDARIGRVLARFAANPMIVGMALGLLVNLAGIAMPEGIVAYAGFVGVAAAPAALFALGLTLSDVRLGTLGPALPVTIAMKVAAQPAVAFLLLGAVSLPGLWQDTAFLATFGPAGAMPFALALGYGVRTDRIAMVVIVTTVASLVALPAASLIF